MYQDTDFISLSEAELIALLDDELPWMRRWALARLSATRPYDQLDPAWIDAALRRSPVEAGAAWVALHRRDLSAHHLDALLTHADARTAAQARAFTDLDALIQLAPGEHFALMPQTIAWLKRDPLAYLDRRLREDRPPLSTGELVAWLLHAPDARPKALANRLLALRAADLNACELALLDALGLRAAGIHAGSLEHAAQLVALLMKLFGDDAVPAPLRAPLASGRLAPATLDALLRELSSPRSTPLTVALRDALASQKKHPAHHASLRAMLAVCAAKDLLLEQTAPDDHALPELRVERLLWRWPLSQPRHLPALHDATRSLDAHSFARLMERLRVRAESIYNANRLAPLLAALLERPDLDLAQVLGWPLECLIEQHTFTLEPLETLLPTLASPARWGEAIRRAPAAHPALAFALYKLIVSSPDPTWTPAQRLHDFERLFAAGPPPDPDALELPPDALRDEVAVALLHAPTLRRALDALRDDPDAQLIEADLAASAILAHRRGALDALPPFIMGRLAEQERMIAACIHQRHAPTEEELRPLAQRSDGQRTIRLRCAQCHIVNLHPFDHIFVHDDAFQHAPNDALLIAPSTRCAGCGAIDAYHVNHATLRAMRPIILAESKKPGAQITIEPAPNELALPDGQLVTLRRFHTAIQAVSRALERTPRDVDLLETLGSLHQGAMSYEEALKTFDQARLLAPDDPVVATRRLSTLGLMERYAEVMAELPALAPRLCDPELSTFARLYMAPIIASLLFLHGQRYALRLTSYELGIIDETIAIADVPTTQPLAVLLASQPEHIEIFALGEGEQLARGALYKLLVETSHGTVVRASPKTGRNDPCPCGSGKKYKKCHGAAEG